MPNLFDYLDWRGDLSFENSPVNEADNLAFCLLSYVDLDGIVPSDLGQGSVSLREAAAEYFLSHPERGTRPLGLILPADILVLFRRMAKTPRFRNLRLTGYVNTVCEEREMQFSALTFLLPGERAFVAFRGTDDSIVGWREDFNLSHMDEVPSQRMAAEYLNRLDLPPDTALYIGGHSKGGNLAVWGAVHANESVRRQVLQVYSNDGPGFTEGTVTSEAYRALADRIRLYLPEDSLVGLLLEHDDRYTVVRSGRKGVFQHDGFSWEIRGASFLREDGLSKRGLRTDTVLRERIDAMTREERERLVRILFGLVEATGCKTLTELHASGGRAAVSILKAYRELPAKDQKTIAFLWEKLTTGKTAADTKKRRSGSGAKPRRRDKGRIHVEFFPLFTP